MRLHNLAAVLCVAVVPALVFAQGGTQAKPAPGATPTQGAKPTPTPGAPPKPTNATPAKPTPTPTPTPAKPAPPSTQATPPTVKPTPTPTPPAKPSAPTTPTTAPAVPSVSTPADYVIGPDDVLIVVVWREKEVSGEVVVRPDGKISLPLLNDVQAAGLTPEQLRVKVTEAAQKYIETPEVTVIVKQINSRRVFITGQVTKPGPYPLAGPTTVLQLISIAGGLLEYADEKKIVILRNEGGKQVTYKFNYRDVLRGQNLKQNIELKPGDTVAVP
jgi:polysaccharide export outer membrane protein